MMKFLAPVLLAFAVSLRGADAPPALQTTPSGLRYKITEHGTGPAAKPGDWVVVQYVGKLEDGSVIDSSRERNDPFVFNLGKGKVIKGWDEGVALLHVGDHATFVVPPYLAYGAKGRGKIPANATLTFDIEVVAIKDDTLAHALQVKIDRDGLDAAKASFEQWKAEKFIHYQPTESDLNGLGYHYLQANQLREALAVLQWNAELHPDSWNVYDSLGEAFVKQGDRELAVANFEKSLALNPKNANASSYLAEFKASPDALQTMQARLQFNDRLEAASVAAEKGEAVPLEDLQAELTALIAKNPEHAGNQGLASNLFYVAESVDLTRASALWAAFLNSPSEKVRSLAESKKGLAELIKAPVELTFTAIDGRPVDVAALRGKVVLIDFWATWCGPCVREIPNVVAAYTAYHDQGFEVIGVSFDQKPEPGKASPVARTANEVLEFTQQHKMPWPQYYDGLYWNNVLGKKYGIRAIPAMFLLDQRGMIVSTNARGKKLEAEIRRLLSQAPSEPLKK